MRCAQGTGLAAPAELAHREALARAAAPTTNLACIEVRTADQRLSPKKATKIRPADRTRSRSRTRTRVASAKEALSRRHKARLRRMVSCLQGQLTRETSRSRFATLTPRPPFDNLRRVQRIVSEKAKTTLCTPPYSAARRARMRVASATS